MTTPDSYHEFFTAAAGVAGALVGLLFVAVSVTMERMAEQGETQIHRVRAATALTSFSNALTVSLFALVPDLNLGYTAFVVGVLGALFVAGALLLAGFLVVLVFQLRAGITLISDHGRHDGYQTIAILVIVCFVIGISRSWELIGGPSIGMAHELFAFRRAHAGSGAAANGGERDGATDTGGSEDGAGSGGGAEPEYRTGEPPAGAGDGPAVER
jgi:hypothetical protein